MLISVITICYNEEEKIGETIESVLKQNYDDYEYIIKDGCSKDRTNIYINEYVSLFHKKNKNLKHFIEKDTGIYNAMNVASNYCNGEYIIFLNAGDKFVDENVLKKCSKKLGSRHASVYYGDAIIEDDAGKAIFRGNIGLIRKRMAFVHQASFIKKQVFNKYLYDENYKICADYDFFLRAFKNGEVFENLEQLVCVYEANGISSTKFFEKRVEHEKILFVNRENNIISFLVHILEAIMKEVIIKICPPKLLMKFKQWYKWRIKKYEEYKE